MVGDVALSDEEEEEGDGNGDSDSGCCNCFLEWVKTGDTMACAEPFLRSLS